MPRRGGAGLIVIGHREHFQQGVPLESAAAEISHHVHCRVLEVR